MVTALRPAQRQVVELARGRAARATITTGYTRVARGSIANEVGRQ
jgi:hypothetical protein